MDVGTDISGGGCTRRGPVCIIVFGIDRAPTPRKARTQHMAASKAIRTIGAIMMVLVRLCAASGAEDEIGLIRDIVRNARGDVDAAKRLLAAARDVGDDRDLQVGLCEKAHEYGISSPRGYASAIAALDMLDRIDPKRADLWRTKRLEVYRLR